MILYQSFREDILERLTQEPKSTFQQKKLDKAAILSDNDVIDRLWGLYQKAIEEYDVDADYAYGDAMRDVLGVMVEGFTG